MESEFFDTVLPQKAFHVFLQNKMAKYYFLQVENLPTRVWLEAWLQSILLL